MVSVMPLSRQSLINCKTKGCPFTPEEHDEWMELCSRAPEHGHRHDQLTHQHHPKKGMGGNNPLAKIVSIICWPMHDRIDNGDWGNGITATFIDGKLVPEYRVWDLHAKTVLQRVVLSAAEERGRDSDSVELSIPNTEASAAAPSAKEEDDEPTVQPVRLSDGDSVRGGVHERPVGSLSPGLTHEQRVATAQRIKDMEWGRQWIAGDTALAWERELGTEEAWQYIPDFGYVQESIANILRVCEAIPPLQRNKNLRFSHHVVVSNQPPETRMILLAECEEEQWSVAEFRRQVKGTKPRVKRWTLEELRERAALIEEGDERRLPIVLDFLDHLELAP